MTTIGAIIIQHGIRHSDNKDFVMPESLLSSGFLNAKGQAQESMYGCLITVS
jgi:hypothetical protein